MTATRARIAGATAALVFVVALVGIVGGWKVAVGLAFGLSVWLVLREAGAAGNRLEGHR